MTIYSYYTYNSTGMTFWMAYAHILHRENGPTVYYENGTKLWYFLNKLHRTDGPATEWPRGLTSYWLNGTRYPDFDTWQAEAKNYQ